MELRGQEKGSTRMPSSSISTTTTPMTSTTLAERRGDHSNTDHQQHQLNLQHQTHKPTRDHDQDPVPYPSPRSRSVSRSPPRPLPRWTSTGSSSTARYRECLRNHAASMGGYVVDGCGEFMACGEDGTEEALICAACECHRNFHRKEVLDGGPQFSASAATNNHSKIISHQRNTLPPPPPPQQSYHQHHTYPQNGLSMSISAVPIAPMMMNFSTFSTATESSSEDLNMFQSDLQGQATTLQTPLLSSKKRFRTKFSQEQKEKMMGFAEKLGWRIQKEDEEEMQQFCSQVGVKRKVFKVWMHNNKQAMKKQQM